MSVFADRFASLSGLLSDEGFDAVALNPGPSLSYISGLNFHLMERPVLMLLAPGRESAIVLPRLETGKLDSLDISVRAFPYAEDPALWKEAFRDAFRFMGLPGKRIGIEGRSLRLLEYGFMAEAADGASFVEAGEVLGRLRLCKSIDEINTLRNAVRIAQAALEATLPQVRIGMTEREFASELTIQLIRAGSDPGRTGSPIVSCGPNGADPHASPSAKKMRAGELLVVDWGASFMGYGSDLTRTFAIGEIDTGSERIHRLVAAANAAGRSAGGPGISCQAVDSAARSVIADAGYGAFFTHRTGHGIGLEGHEAPYIREGNPQVLEPGMVYTVEPGIYLPGRLGVRIEDDVAVTETGTECLSDMPREARVIG